VAEASHRIVVAARGRARPARPLARFGSVAAAAIALSPLACNPPVA
jgi:hypothetical protein